MYTYDNKRKSLYEDNVPFMIKNNMCEQRMSPAAFCAAGSRLRRPAGMAGIGRGAATPGTA